MALEGNSDPDAGLCTGDSCAARFRFLVALETSPTLAAARHGTGTAKPAKRTARSLGGGGQKLNTPPETERRGEPFSYLRKIRVLVGTKQIVSRFVSRSKTTQHSTP